MIRPLTAACMLLACGSGLYLYQVKHRTLMLDHQIEATLQTAETARQRSGVLQAEWTLLNDPERLAGLAGRFSSLQTTQPGQFTTMAELDKRLPPVRPPDAPPQTTDEPPDTPLPPSGVSAPAQPPPAAPATPVARAEPSKPEATTAAAAPAAKPAAPAVVAAAKPAPDRVREAAKPADHPEAAPHETRSGGSLLAAARVGAPAAAYTPATTQYAARLAPQPAAVYTPPPQLAGTPGYPQSALGMARTGSVAPFAGAYNVPNGN